MMLIPVKCSRKPERLTLVQRLEAGQLYNIKTNVHGRLELSLEQLAAATLKFTNETGGAIFSPYTTGKIFTVTVAVHRCARIGRKIVFGTASNKASDAVLAAFWKNAPKDSKSEHFALWEVTRPMESERVASSRIQVRNRFGKA